MREPEPAAGISAKNFDIIEFLEDWINKTDRPMKKVGTFSCVCKGL